MKNQNNRTKQGQSFTEVASKTTCTLAAQDGCYLIPCIHILGSCICLTIFNHGGLITTHPFDINSSPNKFLHILIGVSLTNYSCLGFDISIEWDGEDCVPANEVGLQDDKETVLDTNRVPDDEELDLHDEIVELDEEGFSAGR